MLAKYQVAKAAQLAAGQLASTAAVATAATTAAVAATQPPTVDASALRV